MGQPSIFVSYAWKAENGKQVVDSIEKALEEKGIRLNRDIHLKYKDSIKAFMDALARGDGIIVVLSKPYLQSENCMKELLAIYEKGEFRKRVFPLVLKGTRIYTARGRIPYIKYWDKQVADLNNEMSDLTRPYTRSISASLDLYADIRRSIDRLMDILGDMNVLTKDVHSETDLKFLIEAIQSEFPELAENEKERDATQQFKQKIRSILNEEIERSVCRDLKNALATQCGNPNVVQALENSCQRTGGGLEQAIEWLYQATLTALRGMRDNNIGELDRRQVWEASTTILGWLVLHSINDHWFDENKIRLQTSASNIRIDIPARTNVAIEIILSRNNERPAEFVTNESGSKVFGGRAMDNAIPEFGWSSNTGWEQIKLTVWNHTWGETRSKLLDADETEKLKSVIRFRSRHEGDYYFTISPSDRQNPLNSEQIQQLFARELPELKLIVINPDGNESALLASEIDLEVLISEFLQIGKKWL